VWRVENYAFDRKVVTNTISGYNLGFPGQYYDDESATWYNYWRNYDGATGKYQQSDPVGLAGGSNTYSYANQNPITYVDFLGLTAVNPTDSVNDWLCRASSSGIGADTFLYNARKEGLDKGDSYLVAAERYTEAYYGNYAVPTIHEQDTLIMGQTILKYAREAPIIGSAVQSIFGRNGAPARDASFIAKWGMLGTFHNQNAVKFGGTGNICSCSAK
jgi:RHS repeat-associated protein